MSLHCHLSTGQSVTITHFLSSNFWGDTYSSFNAKSEATNCSGKNYSIDTGPNLTWTQPWFENKLILASNKKGSVPHNIQCRQPKLPDVKTSGNTFTFRC